jgi:hypothetical protein
MSSRNLRVYRGRVEREAYLIAFCEPIVLQMLSILHKYLASKNSGVILPLSHTCSWRSASLTSYTYTYTLTEVKATNLFVHTE